MKFSERKGFTPVANIVQAGFMGEQLRVSLWNVLHKHVWSSEEFFSYQYGKSPFMKLSEELWFSYFKQPIYQIGTSGEALTAIRTYFFSSKWFLVYDFLEFLLNYLNNEALNSAINFVLERELSGYRFVGEVMTDITSLQEIEMLEDALGDDKFPGVQAHLQKALEYLSDRNNPDYRNSIKESISAVESIAQIVSGKRGTLGDALKALGTKNQLHPVLKDSFLKLYGYTSDEGGIRHAMIDEPNLGAADAKFFLLSCTSFINYLKAKM